MFNLANFAEQVPANQVEPEYRDAKPGPFDPPERWLPIPEWPGYEVSDWGRVVSYIGGPSAVKSGQGRRGRCSRPNLIWGGIDTYGRRNITLFRRRPDGSTERRPIGMQILVLTAFVGPCPPGMEACVRRVN